MEAFIKNLGLKIEQNAQEIYQKVAVEMSTNGQQILNQLTGFKEEYKTRLLYYYYCIWIVLILFIIILLAILEKQTGLLALFCKIIKAFLSVCFSFCYKCCQRRPKDLFSNLIRKI